MVDHMAVRLDAVGRACPVPVLMLARHIKKLGPGDEVEVASDDRSFIEDVRAWCEHHGHRLEVVDADSATKVIAVVKGGRR